MLKGKSKKYRSLYDRFSQSYAEISASKMSQPDLHFVSTTYEFCEKKADGQKRLLRTLNLIRIKDLMIGTIHKGSFLKVKVIHKPIKMVSIAILVEDDSGEDCINIFIYNFDTKDKSFTDCFPVGRVFYIKEPFYKIANSGEMVIRIDNPLEVIFQDELEAKEIDRSTEVKAKIESQKDEKRSRYEQLRLQGVNFMKKEQYVNAYALYTSAIKECSDQEYRIKFILNKAIVCFRLKLPIEYGQIIHNFLKAYPDNVKAQFHQVKFEILNSNFSKAESLIERGNFDADSLKQLNKFLNIQRNFRTLKIDWYKTIKNKEVGEYFHEGIQIAKSPFGLGIFSTINLKAGQFLIIQKAMMTTKNKIALSKESPFISYDKSYQKDLVSNVMKLYYLSDQFKSKFDKLSSHKAFGYSNSGKNKEILSKMVAFEDIVENNILRQNLLENAIKDQRKIGQYYGLYEKISMLNHSCEYNCERFCLDQTMFIYCLRDIPKGEELFINYVSDPCYQVRKADLMKWNIDCKCYFCVEQIEIMKGIHSQKEISFQMKKINLYTNLTTFNQYYLVSKEILQTFLDLGSIQHMASIVSPQKATSTFRKIMPMSQSESQDLFDQSKPW